MESWRGFADQLPEKEKQVMKMLNDCYKYSTAINAISKRRCHYESIIVAA
ncbi:MAG: hypothetical protein WB988_01060 [Candidatus Nitrosopolaris sp.]